MITLATVGDLVSGDPNRDMDAHLLVLYSIARFLPAVRAIEIGVDDGSSTIPLLLGAARNGGRLHSIDPAPCTGAHAAVESYGLREPWTFLNRKAEEVADSFPPASVDLVMIDGDHSPAGVRSDWELYEPKVRHGGLILFHDKLNTNEFPGIAALIDDEIRPQWKRWECATLPYGWGLTIVRKVGL